MPALKRVAWLVLLAGCEGPTLHVGELEKIIEFDAGEQDAGGRDAARDAGSRDAQPGDSSFDSNDRLCSDNDDCRNPAWPRCNTTFAIWFCSECQYDRDCRQGEYCDDSPYTWVCKDERKDDPGPSMGGAP